MTRSIYLARLNFQCRNGWSVVKRLGSRRSGFTDTLAADFQGSKATAEAMAARMNADAQRGTAE